MIPRPIETVRGWEKIADRMGVSKGTVQKWKRDGAPIFFRDGKWTAEVAELWNWTKAPEKYWNFVA